MDFAPAFDFDGLDLVRASVLEAAFAFLVASGPSACGPGTPRARESSMPRVPGIAALQVAQPYGTTTPRSVTTGVGLDGHGKVEDRQQPHG